MRTGSELKTEKKRQILADRSDYRQTLIRRRNEIDEKIKTVESQIRKLKGE